MEDRAALRARPVRSQLIPMQPPPNYQATAGELQGRVIAVTGAGEGIGQAVALAAAAHGAQVVLIGRTVKKLESTHARISALKIAEASIAPLDLEKAIAKNLLAIRFANRIAPLSIG